MTGDDALLELASSTAAAVGQVLEMVSGSAVEASSASVIPAGHSPLQSVPVPAVIASVSYVDGVTGGNIFVMTRVGVQRLAAAMMGQDPFEGSPPSDDMFALELSAAGEAMNQMMAAAAGATSSVLGEEVEIGTPETRFFATAQEAADSYEMSAHMTNVSFTLLGEPCRLVQLVPNAFVVKITRALDEQKAEEAAGAIDRADHEGISVAALHSVPVRVSAELGRTRMAVGRAVSLPAGAVVELDRQPDDPLDLFVNGLSFGTGRLRVIDGEWAITIETVHQSAAVGEIQLQGE